MADMRELLPPFCIIGSKGKFYPGYKSYLPAVYWPYGEEDKTPEPILPIHTREYHQCLAEIRSLENKTINFYKEFSKYVAKKKTVGKYKYD